jgi:hypothetical protein
MPQVPVYGDRQVRTDALRPVMQQAPDVSSGARTLAQGLGQVADVADRIDLRNAETKANEVDTQLTREWDKWENENRGKFTNQAADGYTKAVDEWWREAAKTYGSGLDGRAQAMVGKTLARRQTIALEQAGKYEFAEKEKYADSTTAASINTATVNALKTGDYAGEAQRIRDLVAAQGTRKNWSKEQRDTELNARMGVFNTAVIAQLAEKDAAAAQTYLSAAIERGEIRPDQQSRLETIIKGEADNQFATQEAARMAALPLKDQLAEAAKITDPQRREKTINQIRNNYALVREAENQAKAAAEEQAWSYFNQGKPVPEAIISQMDQSAAVPRLREAQRVRSERLSEGRAVKTDFNTWYEVQDKIARGERVDLRGYTEKISNSDLRDLAKAQQTVAKPGELEGYFTKQQRVEGAFQDITGKPAKDDPARAYTFQKAVDNAIMAESTAKKRALTPAEEQDVVDRVAKDVVYVKGFISNAQMPVSLVPREDQASTFVVVPLLDASGNPKLGRDRKPLTKRMALADIPEFFRAESIKSGARTEQQIAEDYNAAKAKGLVK